MTSNELVVKVADAKVGMAGDVLVTYGLGSCVAIVLYDATVLVGGMAHILLPTPSLAKPGAKPQKFPETAIPHVLEEMAAIGANSQRVTARLVGGAAMFGNMVPAGSIQMGERNLVAARRVLNAHNIPVVGEAVGGDFGRNVHFYVDTGVVSISSVKAGVHEI